jgi:hypothetical protein
MPDFFDGPFRLCLAERGIVADYLDLTLDEGAFGLWVARHLRGKWLEFRAQVRAR